jgi:HAE1 family hydrophobic/amphiphilic exporter-1
VQLAKELFGAKVKTVPISILGIAENAPIQLVVMGSDLDSALKYAEGAHESA